MMRNGKTVSATLIILLSFRDNLFPANTFAAATPHEDRRGATVLLEEDDGLASPLQCNILFAIAASTNAWND